MKYAIYFTWCDGTEDSINVDNAKERDFNIKEMIGRGDFNHISYCKVYKNGEYGKIKTVLTESYTYEAYEDNSGGLHLAMLKNGKCTHYFTHLEYIPGELKSAILALQNGNNPNTWDRAEDDPQHYYDEIINDGTSNLIADNDGIYPEVMGEAARLEFGIHRR